MILAFGISTLLIEITKVLNRCIKNGCRLKDFLENKCIIIRRKVQLTLERMTINSRKEKFHFGKLPTMKMKVKFLKFTSLTTLHLPVRCKAKAQKYGKNI